MIIRSSAERIAKDLLIYQSNNTFVLYFGTENESGKSWCSDCVIGSPLVRTAINKYNCILIEVPVGEKNSWNSPDNEFRKGLKLTAIPTLEHVVSKKRLVEDMGNVNLFIEKLACDK
eukprot:NODE_102_length_20354_cov_0.272018.p11 type:complete len:117 gc:universal NODE_102_length_20354_cov_0.272018:4769-5119(+)